MIQLNALSYSANKKLLLSSINCTIPEGKLIGLIGPNGAGKTTLLKLIAGIYKASSGSCKIKGQDLTEMSFQYRAKRIGYLAQKSSIAWPMTVKQVVALGVLPIQSKSIDKDKLIDRALAYTEVTHLKMGTITHLSGGELSRVLLARVLVTNTDILLADEPIAALDPYHQLKVMSILKQLAKEGKTVVVSLHDVNFAKRFCDHILLLKSGKLIAEGPKDNIITPEIMAKAYEIKFQSIYENNKSMLYPML